MSADTTTVAITKSGASLFLDFVGSGPRRPCLILYSGGDAGMPFDLEPGTYVMGRAPECRLHLDNPGISRRHAELQVTESTVTIVDLGSSNGTFVNETRVAAPLQLKGGDMVRLGVVVLRFYESQSLEAALHDRIYRTATVDPGTEVLSSSPYSDNSWNVVTNGTTSEVLDVYAMCYNPRGSVTGGTSVSGAPSTALSKAIASSR